MEKLPKCHVVLIRYVMCVLHHITQRSDENQMTSINLGICIGPSLLWPSVAADMAAQADAARRVPLFVQCMIDNCRQVSSNTAVDSATGTTWTGAARNEAKQVSSLVCSDSTRLSFFVSERPSAAGGVDEMIDVFCSSQESFTQFKS